MLTQDDIIYFIVTDRFSNGDPENDFDIQPDNPLGYHGGDFQGIVDRIPYLQHLGVTALWITPVVHNLSLPQYNSYAYHGYWPLDFEKVDPHLYSPKPGIPEGSKRYLKELVDQLHAAGIKVILDTVVNHTGYEHPALKGDPSTPIKQHWFNAPRGEQEVGDIGSWLNSLPDLKQDEPEVADYFVRVTADWIEETGVDCIRMDTAKHVEGVFWQYYKTVVKGKFPNVSLLGEVLDYNIDHISNYQRHFAFDSLFDFPLQKTLKEVAIYGASCSAIATPFSHLQNPGGGILDRDTAYTNHNMLVTLLDNHDLGNRFFSEALAHGGGDRRWAVETTKLALTLTLTSRGIPQIYYGTELALEGTNDRDDNRRDMPWDRVPNGLEPDEASWEAHDLYHHTRQLIGLRKNSEPLKYGAQLTLYVDQNIYVYIREYRDEWVIIALNFGQDDMPVPLTVDFADNVALPPRLKEQLANQQYVDVYRQIPSGKMDEKKLTLKLRGRSASILMPLKQMMVHVD